MLVLGGPPSADKKHLKESNLGPLGQNWCPVPQIFFFLLHNGKASIGNKTDKCIPSSPPASLLYNMVLFYLGREQKNISPILRPTGNQVGHSLKRL